MSLAANDPCVKLAKRLQDLRESRGWSIRELSRRSGVSGQFLGSLENYPGKNPSLNVLWLVAKAFGMSVSNLLAGI